MKTVIIIGGEYIKRLQIELIIKIKKKNRKMLPMQMELW